MPNLGGLIKPLGILVVQDGEDVKNQTGNGSIQEGIDPRLVSNTPT